MPNQQAVDERPDPPIQEPELDTESKQGNILPGFNKDFQMLLFLRTVRQNPNRTEAQSRRCCHCEERYATKQSLFSAKSASRSLS